MIISKVETVFDFCISEANKRGFDVDSLLEIPSVLGETCFKIASTMSEKLTKYLLDRDIKINTIDVNSMIPEFKFPELASAMMLKGVNPHVIDYAGNSETEKNDSSFKSSLSRKLLAKFPRSIHFSIEDIQCSNQCPVDCPSRQEYESLSS